MRIGGRSSKTLLYQEVIQELYRIIDCENLKPGDKLPAERELIEELNVSRNVLREAFHVLEDRGILISRQGKGRFLRQQPPGYDNLKYESLTKNLERTSMIEAYEVRQVVEVKGVELIIRNASEEDLDELEKAYDELVKRYKETKKTAGEFELHRLYAQKTGSMFMTQTFEIVSNAILGMMYGTFTDILEASSGEWELESHRKIIDALRDRDTKRAQELMHDHLQRTIDLFK